MSSREAILLPIARDQIIERIKHVLSTYGQGQIVLSFTGSAHRALLKAVDLYPDEWGRADSFKHRFFDNTFFGCGVRRLLPDDELPLVAVHHEGEPAELWQLLEEGQHAD